MNPHQQLFDEFYPWFGKAGEYCCCSFGVGAGWASILLDLAWEIREILHNAGIPEGEYAVDQVKEKFGGLRWYDTCFFTILDKRDTWDRIRDATATAETLSFKTCEYCGRDGRLRDSSYWLKTLCHECEAARHQKAPDYHPTGV